MLIFHFHQHLENRRPKLLGGIGNLKIFHTINIYERVAIFQFFHNGQTSYSVSIVLLTLRKLETQTFGGVGNLKFFRMINIYEVAAIFQFFHNG